jgi:hypothetical protein
LIDSSLIFRGFTYSLVSVSYHSVNLGHFMGRIKNLDDAKEMFFYDGMRNGGRAVVNPFTPFTAKIVEKRAGQDDIEWCADGLWYLQDLQELT